MENNQQMTSLKTGLVKDSQNNDILAVIANIFVLLGTNPSKIPKDHSKAILLDFIKNRINCSLEDLYLAFVCAIEKKTNVDLTLYGEMFSPKLVFDVVSAFKEFKNKQVKKEYKSEPMINNDRFSSLIGMLKEKYPDTIEKLKEIGKPEIQKKPKEKLPYYDMHQRWMKQFEKLRDGRFIKRYHKLMNIDEFFNYKAEQLFLINNYLKQRNIDVL